MMARGRCQPRCWGPQWGSDDAVAPRMGTGRGTCPSLPRTWDGLVGVLRQQRHTGGYWVQLGSCRGSVCTQHPTAPLAISPAPTSSSHQWGWYHRPSAAQVRGWGCPAGRGGLSAAEVQHPAPPRHAAAAGTFIGRGRRGAGARGGVRPPPRPPAPQQTPSSQAPRSPPSESPATGGAEAGPAPWQGWGVLWGWHEGCGESWAGTGGPKAGRQQEGSGEAGVPRRDSIEAQPSQIPGGVRCQISPRTSRPHSWSLHHPPQPTQCPPQAPSSPWDPRASSESMSRSIPAGEGRWRGGGWHQHGPSPPMTQPPHNRASPTNGAP